MNRFVFAAMVAACFPVSAFAGPGASGHGHDSPLGQPGDPAKAARTVNVKIGDNFYEPSEFSAKAGETVRFVVKNEGSFLHEFAISDPASVPEHQKMMQMMLDHGMITATGIDTEAMKMPMQGHGAHDGSSGSILIEPGKTLEVTWTFGDGGGGIEAACTIPGHYESGMVAPITISK